MRPLVVLAMACNLNWDQLEGTALVVGQGGIGKAIGVVLEREAPKLKLLRAGRGGPLPLNICSEQSLSD